MPSRYTRSRFAILATLLGALAPAVEAQELKFPSDSVADAAAPPQPTVINDTTYRPEPTGPIDAGILGPNDLAFTSSDSGLYYNPTLGAHLRAEYRTRSYGQQEGTFNLGTMKLLDLGGGVAFLDGQVTLNDDSGVGYNVGTGYRWLTTPLLPWSVDDQKITGVSIWTDGQTIDQEMFFPQIGVSYESLGERFDFRANGYFPIGPRTRDEDFVASSETVFLGNSLIDGQTSFNRTTSLTLGEAELAGRIANLDAWVFGGVYGFNGGDVDAVGGKIGLRGYATPDLLLSIALSNDDEFETNALFNVTWFIGRTRVENAPRGVLTDRFREPVIRNTYVATQQSQVVENNDAIAATFVHVDSSAPAGGDGTFEAPLNSLAALGANSGENDTIVVHADSTFASDTATLQNGQTLLGEGGGTALAVTVGGDTFTLPETADGALAGALPTIDGMAAAAITLANDNSVQNFTVTGGALAVDATNANNPSIENVTVTAGAGGFLFDNVTGNAQVMTSSLTSTTTPAIRVNGGTGVVTVDTATTIADVTGNAIEIVGNQGEVTIGASVTTADTVAGGTVLVNDNQTTVTLDGAISANDADALDIDDAAFAINTSGTITHSGTGDAVSIVDSAANTSVGITIGGAVTNTGGRSVFVDASNDTVSFNSTVSDTGTGVRIEDLAATGQVDFGGTVTANTGANAGDSISLAGNAATSIVSFDQLNITTTNGEALVSDGGEVNVSGAGSTITTAADTAIRLNSGGSSQNLVFSSVTAEGVGDDSAIVATGFNGDITINGGSISTVGANDAVTTSGAGLDLDNVAINGGSGVAIDATFDTTISRSLMVTNLDLSGDGVNVTSSGAANNSVFALAVTGLGDSSFEVTGAGDLDVDLLTVNGPGDINASSTVGSAGNLELDLNGSGNTTQLGAITVNDLGAGDLTVEATNSATSSTYDVTSSGAGNTTVNLSSLTAGGDITIDDQGSGDLTVSATGTTTTGNLAIDSAGGGDGSVTINGLDVTGTATVNSTGTGDFVVDVDGGATFDTTSLAVNANNTGTVTYTLDNVTFDTTGASDAVVLDLGANVTSADVSVSNNAVTAVSGQAFELDINGGATVSFLLSNNSLTNDSASETVGINNLGGTTVDANIDDNTITNNGAGEAFLYTNAAGLDTNLLVTGNGGAGVTYTFVNNAVPGNFVVGGADATEVDDANPANIVFPNAVTFDDTLTLPTFP